MGKMKRIIYIIVAVLTVCMLVGGVVASADYKAENSTRVGVYEENDVNIPSDTPSASGETGSNTDTDIADSSSSAEVTAENATDTAGADGANLTTDTESASDVNGKESGSTGNPFEVLFNTVKEYATEIFCALTFVGSLLLAYAYKCGLIPIIKGGIGALSTVASGIKESAERGEKKTDELGRAVADKLENAETTLGTISENLSLMATKLDKLEADGDEKRKLRIVMNAEVDMLYSIFMTSALPQYQKDEIGERIAKMREVLADDEK